MQAYQLHPRLFGKYRRVRYLYQNLCYRPKERKKSKGEGVKERVMFALRRRIFAHRFFDCLRNFAPLPSHLRTLASSPLKQIYKVESVPWIFLTTFNIYRMQPLLHRFRKHGTHQAVIAAKRRLQSTTSSDPCNINMVNVYVCNYLWRFPRSNPEQTTCIEFICINSFLVWFF